jgi:drug/metabolite transporter (DMT)-like permease
VSLTSIIQKTVLNKKHIDAIAFSIYFQMLVGIIAIPFGIKNIGQVKINSDFILGLSLITFLYCVSGVIYYYSLKYIELSESRILSSTKPVWLLFGGFFAFQEVFTKEKVFGVILIVAGVLIVYWKKGSFLKFSRPQLLVLIYTFISTITALLDKYMMGFFSEPSTYIILSFILPSLLTSIIFAKHLKEIKSFFKYNIDSTLLLFAGVIFNLATYSYFLSLKLGGEVSKAGTIWQSSGIITIILSILILGEREHWIKKIISGIIVFTGIFLMI